MTQLPRTLEPRGNPPVARCFAYGSNLCPAQMTTRCPTARAAFTAVLPRHTLTFGGFSSRWGGAVADVAPHPNRSVPGVVYEMSVADLRTLDRVEGTPFAYRRRLRRVVDPGGASHVVFVYIQAPPVVPGPPTEEYLRTIARGYQRHGIDLARLLAAMGARPLRRPRGVRHRKDCP
jgi:gamma-glutamylcyclotransferase